MSIYISDPVFIKAMEITPQEDPVAIAIHSVEILAHSGLIEANYHYGRKEHLAKVFPNATHAGIIMTPNVHGAELFLWGQGINEIGNKLIDPSIKLPSPILTIPEGFQPIH
jgi:hypothetical protein